MEDVWTFLLNVILHLLVWYVFAAVTAGYGAHGTLLVLVDLQDMILDVLATLLALDLPILAHLHMTLHKMGKY